MTREEKLAEAKRLYKTANADQRYVLECLFPELKEDEVVPHWISVEDELPPQYGTYLVATEGNVIEISLYDIDGWDNWRGGNVTHWMPLPQPPKKGGEK